jgi:ethanolamine permease
LALLAVAGLIASFHTIIFAYGRNIYSLSRAGYLPRWLSITHGVRQTPHVALLVGGAISLGLALVMQYIFGMNSYVGAALLNLAVFWRCHLLCDAGIVFLRPAARLPRYRAAVPQSLGQCGRTYLFRPRDSLSDRNVPQ